MNKYLLEMHHITKRYPGVVALDNVHLAVLPGNVHCLVGENGAGKSTLMKVLVGAIPMDEGQIRIGGEEVHYDSPQMAARLGISMIHQEFNLVPHLSVAENIFLGNAPRHFGCIQWRLLYEQAHAALQRLNSDLDPRRSVGTLSVAQQQVVEIAKALSTNARILIMDEPSAALTDHDLASLFALVKSLSQQGVSIIYISHRLEEIFSLGHHVTVMRDGKWIATHQVSEVDREDLIRMMVGRELQDEFPERQVTPGKTRLRVENLGRKGVFSEISFTIAAGEVVGLTGLVGSGRTEVARALFGADPLTSGTVFLDDEAVRIHSPREAIAKGIGLLTEDRKNQGLVLPMSVRANITMANMGAALRGPLLLPSAERAIALKYVDSLQIKTPHVEEIVHHLSGGTQQKVVLAKWLLTQSRFLIFDEPTRGIDVGAKMEIYRLIHEIAAQGVAILLITSELPEALGMCDRLYVMREGSIMGELHRGQADQEAIMRLATADKRNVAV
ncbi:MAG TPA: sugar ABC transporter ATP-binding protein [Candidatus Hydrogenedentes bacterium]|jgi:ribose transport system ATP-binding protein|nr:sugar ABC transporter ATP-binding protein [Candidatus Hydrogenedentota bacterium]